MQLGVVPAPRICYTVISVYGGSQAVDAYSRIGRTIVLSLIGRLHSLRFLLRKFHCSVCFGDCVLYMRIP